MIGTELVSYLTGTGHSIRRLVRSSAASGEISWNPESGTLDRKALEGVDAVVHLAGENIAEGKWTPEKKRLIRESRVKGTSLLAEALGSLNSPPKVLVSASAIGYYGDRGEEILREDSGPGTGFLPEVCQEWEAAAKPAAEKGIRVVHPRIGIVLSPKGGALAKMLPPFRLGVGGKLGSGNQFMSWITLDELIRIIDFALTTDSLQGPVNAVSPNPVTNAEFTKAVGKALRRPTVFPMPSPVVRTIFGEMGDALLLASTRVHPAQLISASYPFRYPELEGALYHLLRK
jgi:uncharacterized protein (TIGR01777 family)